MATAAPARPSRPGPSALKAWIFVAAVAGLAVFAWILVLGTYTPLDRPISIPWWVLAPLVFAAESAVVHITFGKDAYSFSLSEVVLVLALFLAHPFVLLMAQLLGNSASLVLRRRQAPIKAVFNVAQLGLCTGLATLLFRYLVDLGDPFGPIGWAAAIAASIASIFVAALTINTIIRISGGRPSVREIREGFLFGAIGACVNATLGLLAVFVAWYDPRGLWLALLPPAFMYVAYRTHAYQREHNKRLQSMHAVTEAIHTAPDMSTALQDAASSARELVNATWLEIIVFANDDHPPRQTLAHEDGTRESMVVRSLDTNVPDWWLTAIGDATSVAVHEPSRSAIPNSPPIDKDAIVAPIVGAERLYGYVLAADRLGDVSTFNGSDLQLLETVAKQVSVALDNGRLETSLASVTALKDQLEVLVRSKDQFVATIAHELRTPLTAVVGLAEVVNSDLEHLEEHELEEFTALITDQANELGHIVEDLLVAARADIGTLSIRPERVDVIQLLTRMTASQPGPHIDVSGDGGDAWVDPLRLRQIVRNLLTNARRYGGDTVAIEARHSGDLFEITVLDNGPGVPLGLEEAVFEPYERGNDPDSSAPGSVGLGLAVARQLARLMGGDLVYERDESTARFVCTIPRFVDGLVLGPALSTFSE